MKRVVTIYEVFGMAEIAWTEEDVLEELGVDLKEMTYEDVENFAKVNFIRPTINIKWMD